MKCLLFLFAFLLASTTWGLDQDTKVLFLPSYGNESAIEQMWFLRFQGLVYKETGGDNTLPPEWQPIINDLSNSQNLTSAERLNLNERLAPFTWDLLSDQTITVIASATDELSITSGFAGDFDEFSFVDGIQEPPQSVHYFNTTTPNGTFVGYDLLLSSTGYSIISDIDDVLRVAQVWDPVSGVKNAFVNDYVAIPGMPDLFQTWASTLPNPGFHYVTTAPIQLEPPYQSFLNSTYPIGSLDMRPPNFTRPDEVLSSRRIAIQTIFDTFPNRTYVLLGDTSSLQQLETYTNFAKQYPDMVQCIFVRNLTATEPTFPQVIGEFDLALAFAGIPSSKWFVYQNATELESVYLSGGFCQPNSMTYNDGSNTLGAVASSGNSDLVVSVILLVVSCFCGLFAF